MCVNFKLVTIFLKMKVDIILTIYINNYVIKTHSKSKTNAPLNWNWGNCLFSRAGKIKVSSTVPSCNL